MKELKQITVIGLGLLGGSISAAVLRCFPRLKVVGYSHRQSTRAKAAELAVATEICDSLPQSVCGADIVILATPISTFKEIFTDIGQWLPEGCIVTDVGSTKVQPHRWADVILPKTVHYIGSHPIAGAELRGVEYSRDDLLNSAVCVLTTTKKSNPEAVEILRNFWTGLGCSVKMMTPAEHDRVYACVSHLPHIAASALVNATVKDKINFSGKGFLDTTRIASGPSNIWVDVLLSNSANSIKGIDLLIVELNKFKDAIRNNDRKKVEKLLELARTKRAVLIDYKLKHKEIL